MKKVNLRKYKNRAWLILNIVLTCIYLGWRILYTIPIEFGLVSLIVGIPLIVVEVLGALEAAVHYFNMHKIETYPLPKVPLDMYPDVDVYIATYSETNDLLFKTVNGCLYMDYPDKNKVHIYLCDDSRRPEVRKLAQEMGINYIDREDNKGAKAGNLNHAMTVTSSPLIVTFDADMIPKHDFLVKTVPYFIDAEIKNKQLAEKDKIKLGFIQTPQSFYNPDLFQFNLFSENRIPNEQDYFYKDIQISRNKTNSVIYGGSNTLLSRAALVDIGGFFMGSITEDFATGILLQKKGYICYAINEVLASGLSPTDLKSLLQQRVRWARGVITTGRKMHILSTPNLNLGQKANYMASIWYWYVPIKRLIYIMSPILFATFGYIVLKCTLLEVLIFWLPMYVTSNISLRMLSRNIRTTKWTGVYETLLFPFMLFPVILETFGITLKKFKVTKKGDFENEKGKNIAYMIPFIVLIVLSVIGIFNLIGIIFESSSLSPIVVLFWLIINLFSLVMSVFFVQGREFMRKSERVTAEIDCEVQDSFMTFVGKTKDFSENGVSIILNKPVNIDDEQEVNINLNTDRYHAKIRARIVHVEETKDGWKYAFYITDMLDSYKDYLQILYDRVPTLPLTLADALSSFDDLKLNVSNRTKETFYQNRRLPRINMDIDVKTKNGRFVHIINYNYKYIVLSIQDKPKELQLIPVEGLELKCKYERTIRENIELYAIKNYNEIHTNVEEQKLLEEWIEEVRIAHPGKGVAKNDTKVFKEEELEEMDLL
ncbi:glycosyltransferase [Clostridium vincentii]|uniref:Cellulose synthase catalytic subunit n=1 Tax=Clostridium vincentii TaxID=52704 RepID=A0A2T0BCS0_9CLOT|nr:glycosyltransferase [Clostridium vincentii]PRR81681.1 Cellulose synthase catalytic subunit [Clostridium vincentii]